MTADMYCLFHMHDDVWVALGLLAWFLRVLRSIRAGRSPARLLW